MNREQARANLVTIGIEEPTAEQITNYLNQLQGETKIYSDRANQYKADADRTAELQKQLDEIENKNLSDIDKANKTIENANAKVVELENTIKAMTLKTSLAEKGIVGDYADKLIAGLNGGTLDVEVLGQIISERELASATAKEKEIADNSTNPNGGSSANGDSNKTEGEKSAGAIAKAISGNSTESANVVSSYM